MVHISELRVVLPMTVEEFRRAQRYANFKTNELNISESQGGQLLSILPYEHDVWGEGQYTHSLYRLGDRLPDWVSKLVPSNALVIDEKTWMAYPYIHTIISIPFFQKLKIEMWSMHANDDGSTDNILNFSGADLAVRKVEMVDIAFDEIPKRDYQEKLDPKLYKSKKTGRGPLRKEWQRGVKPVMCAYKMVKVDANYWGVQNRVEKLMLNGIRQVVLLTHRNAFCWLDEWFDLTYEEICDMEKTGRQRLKAAVKQLPIIDPATGKELVIEDEENGKRIEDKEHTDSDYSDTSDIEAEYFEAEMEWANQGADHFGTVLPPDIDIPQSSIQFSDVPERCAVCAARGNVIHSPVILCRTCREFFCQQCFSEFHVTPRLKAHVVHHVATSLMSRSQGISLESTGSSGGLSANDGFVIGTVVPSTKQEIAGNNGPIELDHQDWRVTKTSFNKQEDKILRDLGNPLRESKGPPRTTSKLWNSRTGLCALNSVGVLEFDNEGILPQEPISAGPDIGELSKHPNQLSEELFRTMASFHQTFAASYSLNTQLSAASQDLETSKGRLTQHISQENKVEEVMIDPYGIKQGDTTWDIGSYANMWEVTVLPTVNKSKEYAALYPQLRGLLEGLKHVQPREMSHEQRMAFWINIYHSLILHHVKFESWQVAYIVGGHPYSVLAIEHSVLRAHSHRPALAYLLPVHKFKKTDERSASALDHAEPLISFALCCGSRSSPVMRVYTGTDVRAELQASCKDFLLAAVGINRHKRVLLPKILHWYARDFSHDAQSLMEWISTQLPQEKKEALRQCLKKSGKQLRHHMTVLPYDWSFRYLFDRNIHDSFK
ncbi:unnamed protein product [Sphagnum compactum]